MRSPACLLRGQLISLGPETQRRACEKKGRGISKGGRTRGASKRKKKKNCFLRSNQETLQSLLSRSSSRGSRATHISRAPVTSQGIHSAIGTVTIKWGEPTLLFNPMESLTRPMGKLRATVRRPIARESSLRRTRTRRGPRS